LQKLEERNGIAQNLFDNQLKFSSCPELYSEIDSHMDGPIIELYQYNLGI